MNSFIETLNQCGEIFLNFAGPMFWQSSFLVGVLLAFDFLWRRKLRASIRYALWLVVLAKLMLPPTLALPTSPVWWLHQTPPVVVKIPKPNYTVTYDQNFPAEIPQTPPAFIPAKPKLTIAAWLLAISISVSTALLAWLLTRWWQITRQVRRAKTSERLAGIVDKSQAFLGMKKNMAVKLTANSMSPAVCGLLRPAILIPQSLAENFSDEQLRAVLLHELIHLRRRDVWVNFLQALLQIFYWWHPLVWLANARIRRVREEAVDDAVMLALRDDAETYAPTLLEVAKLALNRPLVSLGLVGIMESRNALRQRIERLLNFRAPKKAGLTFLSFCGIFIFSAVALPMGEKPNAAAENNFAVSPNEIAKATTNVKTNVPQILITGHFYRGSATDVEKILSQQKSAVRSVDENSWIISAKGFGPIHDQLDAPEFQQISMPRVVTLNAEPAEFYVGNQTNSISFLCRPVITNDSIHLDFKGTTINGLNETTNHFQVNATAENKGGFLVHVENAESSPANNLFVFVGVEIITNSAAWEKEQRSKKIAASQTVENPTNFYTRTFKVDSKILISNLKHVGISVEETTNSAAISKALRKFFATLGVDMEVPAGKAVFYNDRNDLIVVKATGADLDMIERVFVVLNQVAPQIHIKARFYEMPAGTLNGMKTNGMSAGEFTGILTRSNSQMVLKQLQARKGIENLGEPEVTTTSGRQVACLAGQQLPIIGSIPSTVKAELPDVISFPGSLTNDMMVAGNKKYPATPLETGVRFEGSASALADGQTIEIHAKPSFTEFFGYAPGKENDSFTNALPSIRVRKTETLARLYDGQTLLMAGFKVTTSGEEIIPKKSNKELIVLVTTDMVDAAGNRIHSDNELPLSQKEIPPQPQK